MRFAFLPSIALAAVALAACHSHERGDGPRADEFFYDCENNPAGVSIYATDESFVELINKEAANGLKVDDAQAPQLMAPAAGATLSATTPPMVAFKVGAMASRGPARPTRACAATALGRWTRIKSALSPVSVAHAHCPAVSGENFLFRVTAEGGGAPLYTAQLSVTSFTPGAEPWRKALMGRVGQTVTITLARATYSKGTITAGPYVSSAVLRFAVGP